MIRDCIRVACLCWEAVRLLASLHFELKRIGLEFLQSDPARAVVDVGQPHRQCRHPADLLSGFPPPAGASSGCACWASVARRTGHEDVAPVTYPSVLELLMSVMVNCE